MQEKVILVDSDDNPVGEMEKLQAHEEGLLHRAISVFIYNSKGEMLLQRRAFGKYHSAGLWSNTCCSHPRPGETTDNAAVRRLEEEMGMHVELTKAFSFEYRAPFIGGLVEHELDHVYVGVSDDTPVLDPEEAAEWQYVPVDVVRREMKKYPHRYTEWFKICFERTNEHEALPIPA